MGVAWLALSLPWSSKGLQALYRKIDCLTTKGLPCFPTFEGMGIDEEGGRMTGQQGYGDTSVKKHVRGN